MTPRKERTKSRQSRRKPAPKPTTIRPAARLSKLVASKSASARRSRSKTQQAFTKLQKDLTAQKGENARLAAELQADKATTTALQENTARLEAELDRIRQAPADAAEWQPTNDAALGVTFTFGQHVYERALEALRGNPYRCRRFALTPLFERDRVIASFTMPFEDAVGIRRLAVARDGGYRG